MIQRRSRLMSSPTSARPACPRIWWRRNTTAASMRRCLAHTMASCCRTRTRIGVSAACRGRRMLSSTRRGTLESVTAPRSGSLRLRAGDSPHRLLRELRRRARSLRQDPARKALCLWRAHPAARCAGSGINNAIRGLAAIVKRAIGSQGSAIASAATTAIGAADTALYTTITGATPITSFGSVGAGTFRIVEFTSVLTLTHNATSLKLPASANITTAAGDVGFFLSLGSGNWKCLHYSKADGSAVASFNGTLVSTDPGSTSGPDFVADRNSASPSSNDILGSFVMRGRSSTAVVRNYARLRGIIADPTNGSEDGQTIISAMVNGTETDVSKIGPGVQIGSPTGGDKGLGTINLATSLYLNGGAVHLRLQKALVSTAAYDRYSHQYSFR